MMTDLEMLEMAWVVLAVQHLEVELDDAKAILTAILDG